MQHKRALWFISLSLALSTPSFAASDRAVALSGNAATIVGDLNEELDQLFDVSSHPLDSIGGTANDITASVADMPALTSLVNGMKFTITPTLSNTGPVDIAIDGTAEKDLVLPSGAQLGSGEFLTGTRYLFEYLGGASDHYRLLTTNAGAAAGAIVINVQTFTASGTYTPSAGIEHAIVTCTGGGAGGGGADLTSNGDFDVAVGGGGGGGATAREEYSAAALGASQAITIGDAGTAGSNTGGDGGAGGDTTFGSLMTAGGGTAGDGRTGSGTNVMEAIAAPGGTATGGDVNIPGGEGRRGIAFGSDGNNNILQGFPGAGGDSFWGSGASSNSQVQEDADLDMTANGTAATIPGTGGSGGLVFSTLSGATGGAGAPGICVVQEFI